MSNMLRKLLEEGRRAAAQDDRRLHRIAPVTEHRLDPVTTPHDVANMAGFNGRSHDAMQGVDQMVMGHVDAVAELEVDSATPGSPMQVHESESILNQDRRHDQLSEDEHGTSFDWCGWL